MMASADTLTDRRSRPRRARQRAATGRAIRSPSPARSCRRCRRWSPARSTSSTRRVVTVGRISAGTTEQRHPRDGRDPRHDPRRQRGDPHEVHDNIRRVAEGIAAAHGAAATVDIETGYPVTVNDGGVRRPLARDRRRRRRRRPRGPAAEPDHGGRGLQLRPAAGAGGDGVPRRHAARADPATAAPNHSNRVFFDEQAMSNMVICCASYWFGRSLIACSSKTTRLEWFGAAVAGSTPGGVPPRNIIDPGTRWST